MARRVAIPLRSRRPVSAVRAVLVVASLVAACFAAGRASASAEPVAPPKPDYQSMLPARLADTRPGYQTIDGQVQGVGRITPGSPRDVPIAGRAGVPAVAELAAVALNVTVVDPLGAGFLTVYPSDVARPLASNVNFDSGQTVANSVIAKLSATGRIRVFASASAHVIVDIAGYWTAGGIVPLNPVRLADTRIGSPTIDGQFAGTGPARQSAPLNLSVAGRAGVPAGATSVALNVVVTGARDAGFLTAYASGSTRPWASNLNYTPGATTSNQVIAPIGSLGRVTLYVSASSADVVVDLAGYFTAGSDFHGVAPARIADTRAPGQTAMGPPEAPDRDSSGIGPIGYGAYYSQMDVLVHSRAGVADEASAVAVNVTVTDPAGAGFVTVFPTGSALPNASSVNVVAGQIKPNFVMAKVGRGGLISVYTNMSLAHIVIDVIGYVPAVSQAPQLPYYNTSGHSWDRCRSILYEYNPTGSTPAMIADVEFAIAQIALISGLDFVRLADSTASPARPDINPGGYLEPVRIGFGTAAQYPDLAGAVAGYAAPAYVYGYDEFRYAAPQLVTGHAIFDTGDGLVPGGTFRTAALHELGHLVGLDHVDNAGEVMNRVIGPLTAYGPGDTLGMRVMYRTQDCPGQRGDYVLTPGSVALPDYASLDREVSVLVG